MSDYAYSTTDPAATVSLTTAYAAAQMTGFSLEGIDVPSNCYLFRLEGSLTNIAGGASSVTWYVSTGSGEGAITNELTVTILDADGDGTGTVQALIDTAYVLRSGGVAGALYVNAKLDAGTADGQFRVYWSN